MSLPFHLDALEIVRRLIPILMVVAVSQAYVVPLLSEWRYGRAGFERRYQGSERLTAVMALGFGLALPVMYVVSLPSLRERHDALTRFENLGPEQVVTVLIENDSGKRLLEGHEKIRRWLAWKKDMKAMNRPVWGLGEPAGRSYLVLEGLEESYVLNFWSPDREAVIIEVNYGGMAMGRYRVRGFDAGAGIPVSE